MARSISATNPSAALSLLSRYQRSADFNSARASSWISSGLSAVQDSGYLSTRLRPGDRLYFARIQFLDATGDFSAPRFFGGRGDGIVKAFEQRTDQGGASLGRQRQRLLEKLGNVGSHWRILAPVGRLPRDRTCHPRHRRRSACEGSPKAADCPAGRPSAIAQGRPSQKA